MLICRMLSIFARDEALPARLKLEKIDHRGVPSYAGRDFCCSHKQMACTIPHIGGWAVVDLLPACLQGLLHVISCETRV